MKKAVLFDLDGTLLDTLQDLTDSVNFALSLHGYPLRTKEQILAAIGNGARELIRLSLPQEGREDVDRVLADYQVHYRCNCQNKTRPYPGVLQALARIGQKYAIAIVSNKPDAPVKKLCADYFPGIFALGERPGCPRKPAPDMLQAALSALQADRCVYVGDSEVDVQTAAALGVSCISVTWGFRREEDLQMAGADYFCRRAEELPALVEKLLGE